MIYVLIFQDHNLHLVGPFGPSEPHDDDKFNPVSAEDVAAAKERASAYGKQWQKFANDDPRWQIIALENYPAVSVFSTDTIKIAVPPLEQK